MNVRCNKPQALEFLDRLSRGSLGPLHQDTCWQQIKLIAPAFSERILLAEVRLLFETYLDYILKSSDRDMSEVEMELDRLEAALDLKGKLPAVYRPIVEKMMEDKGEVERILRTLRQQHNRSRTKRRNECNKAAAV